MAHIQHRKRKNGTIGYRVQIRRKTFPLITATFDYESDAIDWANDIERDITKLLNSYASHDRLESAYLSIARKYKEREADIRRNVNMKRIN